MDRNLDESLASTMEEDPSDAEIFSSYEAQLHSLFSSCDSSGKGFLDREGLHGLCNKLGLDQDQSQKLFVSIFVPYYSS